MDRLPRFGLSKQGRLQARTVVQALKDKPVAVVYGSPLLRARQTVQAILEMRPDLSLRISSLLNKVT